MNNQSSQEDRKRPPQKGKRKFYRYSDIDEKNLGATEDEQYDDTKRRGLKEWDEEYTEYNEEDLGTDFGKP